MLKGKELKFQLFIDASMKRIMKVGTEAVAYRTS